MFSFSDLLYGKPPGSVFTRRLRIRIQEVKKIKQNIVKLLSFSNFSRFCHTFFEKFICDFLFNFYAESTTVVL